MSRRSIRILSCSAALLSLLALATPAQAAGWTSWTPDAGILQATWNWITGIWMPGQPAQGQARGKEVKSDRSSGLDPDGLLSPAPPCQTGCTGVGPNG